MRRKLAVKMCLILAFVTAIADLLTYVPVQNLGLLIASGELMPWFYGSDLDDFSTAHFSIRPGAVIYMSSKDYPDCFGTYYTGRFVCRCHHYGGAEDYAIRIPLVIPLILFLIYPAIVLVEYLVRGRRLAPGHCVQCGYNLTGNISGVCPECGEPRRWGTNATDMSENVTMDAYLNPCDACGGDSELLTLRPLWLLAVGLGIPVAWYALARGPVGYRSAAVVGLLGTAVTSAVFLALFIERAILSRRGWFRICRHCGGTGQEPSSKPSNHSPT